MDAIMKRILFASFLALLITSEATPANAQEYGYGTAFAGPGLGFINKTPSPFGCSPFGFQGLGFRMFAGIHQHGPLMNYGPYEGYYPFEPYGPWTSNLEYTGPMNRPLHFPGLWGAGGGNAEYGFIGQGRLRGRSSGIGSYALSTFQNIKQRLNPFGRFRHGSSGTCGGGGCSSSSGDLAWNGAKQMGDGVAPVVSVQPFDPAIRER